MALQPQWDSAVNYTDLRDIDRDMYGFLHTAQAELGTHCAGVVLSHGVI